MAGVNKVILIGNLGKDPEVRYLDSGVAVANFSLATTESYKNKEGERVSQTEWHNVVLWRGLAEVAEKWLKKGSSVYIEGKIRSRKWEDKEGNINLPENKMIVFYYRHIGYYRKPESLRFSVNLRLKQLLRQFGKHRPGIQGCFFQSWTSNNI